MAKQKDRATPADQYDAHRDAMAGASRARSTSGRDIGPLPPVGNPARRDACERNFRLFCETYLFGRFRLAWSADHLKCVGRIEATILDGGQFALAMPRGSGKTTLVEAGSIWAVLNGHRLFVVLIGATEGAAVELLDSIKMELETNDLLSEDFPAVCHPVRMLDGIHNRAKGQTLDGKRTRITWTDTKIVLPTIDGARSSGAVLRVVGITGRVRGMKHSTADGRSKRPDLVIPDDPQTDESANSPTQNAKREAILAKAVLGLAGPGEKISAVMPCTVIAPRDMADRILDRETHPEWNGERTKLVYTFPERQDLWDRYADVRAESFRSDRGLSDATAFYAEHRAAMDQGAVVAWPERFNDDELSAIQYAMNLRIADYRSFMAEYQNDPVAGDVAAGAKELLPAEVAKRLSGAERLTVPRECSRLTAFIDCGGSVLWYLVAAWTERFGGSVVDYGTWPRQSRAVFAAADVRPSLADLYAGHSEEQRVYAGLTAIAAEVLGRTYFRETAGDAVLVERCLVDCGWLSKTVYQWVRSTPFAGVVYPSKGIARTTTARGVSEWKPRAGERSGHHWRLTTSETGKGRMIQFDPDSWKSFLHGALVTPPGGPTGITFFGKSAGAHELVSEHCAAETSTPVTLRGATFDKWQIRPDRPDNHLWDCLVGAAVAASVAGVVWTAAAPGQAAAQATPRPKVKLSEVLAKKRAARGE